MITMQSRTKFIPFLVAILAFLLGTATGTAQIKIGTIEMDKAFDAYWRTKKSNAEFSEQQRSFDRIEKGFVQDINTLLAEIQNLKVNSEDPANSAEKRLQDKKKAVEKENDLRILEQRRRDNARRTNVTLREQNLRLIRGLMEKIDEVITAQAKALGYNIVLNSGRSKLASSHPSVLFTDGSTDFTDAVIAALNKDAPKEYLETKDGSNAPGTTATAGE